MTTTRCATVSILMLAVILIFSLTASCGLFDSGGGGQFRLTSVDVTPATMNAGDPATATVNFAGTTGPFTFTFSFSGGVTPLEQTVTVQAPASTAVLNFTTDAFAAPDPAKDITVTVIGVDGNGELAGTVNDSFHVAPASVDPPVIDSAAFDAPTCTVTVTAHDPDGDPITINLSTVPAGATADAASKPLGAGGTVDFVFSPTDIFAGGGGTAGFTATANGATTAETTVAINCPAIGPGIADTLLAIPLETSVAVGAPVTIVVATGVTPNPFQYLAGVRVTAPTASGFAYVADSFNVGLPGGADDEADGAWTAMAPAGGFLMPPENFILPSDAGGGLTGIDFNLTPIGGSDVSNINGALFNFKATFTTAGTYQLGFQGANGISLTFYQDHNLAPNYSWGDIANNHAGVPNSVTVQ